MKTNRSVATRLLAFGITLLATVGIGSAASFTPGNIVVYRAGDGTAALASSGTAVFLDEYTTAGVFVQTITVPTTTVGSQRRLVCSGTATSEGFLTRSADGQYVVLPGYDAAPGTASITTSTSATVPRVIGRVDASGALDTTTALTDAISGGNPRGVTAANGTDLWITGSTQGVRYAAFGATTSTLVSSTATNMRSLSIFGGQLYVSSGAGTVRMATVGSGTPTTTGQVMTQLTGVPVTGAINEFFFADLDGNPGIDTLYLSDETTGSGQVQKWTLSGGTWTATGSVAVPTARGLAGSVSGGTVTLIATGGGSGTPIFSITDASGYNGTLTGTPTTIVASAGTNKAFRAVAFVPVTAGPAPTVSSIVRASTSPTNAASVNYTVTFSQSVTGVDSSDFSFTLSGVSGASVSGVSGSGTTYTVTVNTGTGSGTLRLDVTDNDSIINGSGTPLGGSGAGNGNFTGGEVYSIDKTAPSVSSINRASTNPTNASSVNFTVTFSEAVFGVVAGNFSPAMTGVSGAIVGTPTTSNNIAWTVPVNTGSGDGTLGLDLTSTSGITDAVGNVLSGTHPSDQSYTIDKTPPTVVSIVRVNSSPTAAATVDYTVTFSESVVNVDTADFTVTATGLTGTGVTNVTGSGATRTVTVSTGTGSTGTVRLDVNAPPTISDAVGNAETTGFTTGDVYTIDRNAPSVSSVVRASANPTNAASVNHTVTFSQSVTGVDGPDFQLTTTGVTGATVGTVSGSGTTYTVAVNTGTGDGTIRLDVLNDGTIQSGTAVPLTGGTFTNGEVYTVDKTAPTVSSIVRVESDPTKLATVHFTATFGESVTGVTASTFALAAGGVTGTSITGVSGSGTTWTVTVNTGSGDGTLGLNSVADAAVLDTAGNALTTPFTGQVFTIDKTAPTVVSINRADANPTAAASVNFTVTFSESVTGVDSGDFNIVATGPTGTSITGVTGSGTTWTVTVNSGSGDGTIGLNLTDNDSIADAATNPLGGTGAGNGNFTGQIYTIDKNAPSVVSINRVGTSPTAAASVSWTVVFSEAVTGVDTGDFALVATGVSGSSITGVSGGGTTYTVSANSGTGSGTLGLNLVDDDSIVETTGFGTQLGGSGASNGNFTGQVFTLDHTAPTVVSIVRAGSSPTAAATVQFTVTFSESVTGVGIADFAAVASGVSGAAVTNVTGSGTTYTVTTSTGTGSGTVGLNLVDDDSIIDVVGNQLGGAGAGNGNFTGEVYTVNRAPANHIVISQLYGGGGNSGATFRNDFIELFNPTGATQDLTGWSVQYSSATGSSWQVTNLTGSIAPGHYYLVQESSNAAVGAVLPTPDASAVIAMAAGAGKVALVNQTTALSGSCPTGITIIDFAGYGSTANCAEGGSPTGTPSATVSVSRIDNGCTDTDHNNTDFATGPVNPRNSASPTWSCGGLVGNGTATPSTVGATGSTLLKVAVTPGQSPTSTGITAIADLTPIGGSATQTLYDDGSNGDVTPGDNIFSFNAVVGGATSSGSKIINIALADQQSRTGASSISLTVLGSTNPSGTGSASPGSVAPNQSSLLTVVVTPGQNPASTGITVSADLTSIGGSASQTLFDDGTNGDVTLGDGTFSYNATVANGTSLGVKSLPVTIHDVQGRTGSTSISLTIQSATAPPAPTSLVATAGNLLVGLTWSASTGATNYKVYRGTAVGGPYPTTVVTIGTTSYNDTSVSNGTHYYYIVTAVNATNEESGPSNEANAIPAAPPPAGSLGKVYFIDIGQGASTLIVSPTGKTLLVDGGETGQGNAKVIPTLNTLGITTLDYTVLTHYHIDHDGGLAEVINAGRLAGTAYDNGDDPTLIPPNFSTSPTSTYGTYAGYVAAINAHSGTVTRTVATPGTVIDLGGGMRATIMAQGGHLLSGGQVTIDNSDLNTESISVFVEYNNFDFLVSGDMTGGGSTDTAKTPDVETYVAQMVGDVDMVEFDHHGSTTANNRRFLKILKAEAAEAEAGFTNTFGHPNRETFNKFLNIPDTAGNTYGGTALPNPGNGPVAYQTDPSPTGDQRCTLQGYSGASTSNAGQGTLLLKTDGTTSFTIESFDDGGVRIPATAHIYGLDATGAGVTTNFPPTVQTSISPVIPLATDTTTVSASVFDREDAITSVTLNYAINGVSQTPVGMSPAGGGVYTATIAPQSDGTRVDYTVTGVAGGQSTSYSTGYFAGTTPISTLRAMDSLGSPLYWDYAARVQGVVTSGTGNFATGTNDDYLQDATGAINIWRTIQPTTPAVQTMNAGSIYSVAGLIGESAGKLRLEVTPPFVQPTTPYQITFISNSSVPAPLVKTIAQINAGPESLEARLITINNCHITSGTIPGSPAAIDGFLTISDGTGSFQLKIDHNTDIPGMATPGGTLAITGILQQDDFLRPFDSDYDIAPRNRTDLGGVSNSAPGLISIADARIDVDASGNPPGDYVPDLLNQNVQVQGVVTSINFRQSNGSGIEYYIQDPTGGVDIFSTATTRSFNIGDNLDVIGTVKQFNGLTEFDPGATLANLTLLAPGTLPAVTPQVVTCSQLGDSGVGEPLEGRLLRVNNVTLAAPPATWVASTNYVITDGTGSATIRISASSNLVGVAPPAGTFSIVGVLGQFDSAAPFDSGYQLIPRSTADMLPAVATPASISATAGTPQSALVNTTFATPLQATVRDSGNATISNVNVTFSAPASGASGVFGGGTTVVTDVNGVATAPSFTANAASGNYNVTATVGAFTATFSLTNLAPAATHFSVSAPPSVTSGVPFSVTVTALNASNATVTSYVGTVHFSSSSGGTLPADYTFVGGDNGTHIFSATLTTTGNQTLDATDAANSLSGSAPVTVTPPPATHYSVTAPANVTSGVAFNVTVTALDVSNATVPGYTGIAHFTSSSAGTLPSDYTFVGGDSGTHTFSVTLTATGAQTITGTDTVTASINGTANTTVAAPPATHYSVSAPANVTNGVAFNVTVTALDASNATVTGYTGIAHFTSTSTGTLPSDYTFVGGDNGTHTFSVTLTSNGARTITATDTVTASIAGTANTTVLAAPATHYNVTAPATTTPGTAFNVTVTALDASNATVTGYAGTVHFTSSSAGTLPANYAFAGGDNGTHTFSVTLTSPGAQTVTATDTVTATITGTASTTGVCPPFAAPTASNSGPACAGTPVNLFATAPIAASFSWTGPGGFTSTQQNPTGITVAGTYTVTVTSTNPCFGSPTASTTVVINPIPVTTIATGGTTCALSTGNAASVANAGVGATYAWSIVNGTITSGAGTPSILYTAGASGSVHLSVAVSANACGSSSSADVAINSGPTITLPSALSSCNPALVNVPFTLTGSGPWTVSWSDGVNQVVASSPSSRDVNVTTTTTLGVVLVSDSNCAHASTASVIITIGGGPVINTQPVGQIVNPGSNATFTVAASGGVLHYQWFVHHGNGTTLPVGSDSPTYTTNPEGNATWFVRVTNSCGSVNSDSVTATVTTPRHHPSL